VDIALGGQVFGKAKPHAIDGMTGRSGAPVRSSSRSQLGRTFGASLTVCDRLRVTVNQSLSTVGWRLVRFGHPARRSREPPVQALNTALGDRGNHLREGDCLTAHVSNDPAIVKHDDPFRQSDELANTRGRVLRGLAV
jgi:hypothetical protein